MNFLVDTNIVLELLLDQEKRVLVTRFFDQFDSSQLFMSDFSIHSIGVILFRRSLASVFNNFINVFFKNTKSTVLSLTSLELSALVELQNKYLLDFDDAYQYAVAEKNNLEILSFDSDFDKTPKKRYTPDQIVNI